MHWPELIIAALVQGVTEFLPISSSSHLAVLHALWGTTQPTLAFDVWLHLGTTLTIVVALRQTIRAWWTSQRQRWLAVVIAMGPTVVIGWWLHALAEATTLHLQWMGSGLMITGGWLALGNWSGRRWAARPSAQATDVTWQQALLIGCAQGLAVMPGISRSGATIATALGLGVAPRTAVHFSLLLAIPTVAGAALVEFGLTPPQGGVGFSPLVWGTGLLVTFLVGLGAIQLLERVTTRYQLTPFAWYCGVVGMWLFLRGMA